MKVLNTQYKHSEIVVLRNKTLCDIEGKDLYQMKELVSALTCCTTEFGMSFEVTSTEWEMISSSYRIERERVIYILKLLRENAVPIQEFLRALWKIPSIQQVAINLHDMWCEKFGGSLSYGFSFGSKESNPIKREIPQMKRRKKISLQKKKEKVLDLISNHFSFRRNYLRMNSLRRTLVAQLRTLLKCSKFPRCSALCT